MKLTVTKAAMILAGMWIALANTPARAYEHYWSVTSCGSSSWDQICWSTYDGGGATLAQPLNGDNAYLYNSGTNSVVVNYATTLNPSPVLNSLYVDATGTGTMTLTQTKDSLAAQAETVGYLGTGTFNQSGGANTLSNNGALAIGANSSSVGTYNLSGTGSLSAYYETIGVYGTGTLNQSGGSNTTNMLQVGGQNGSHGVYNLSAGNFSAHDEYIGIYGTGTFSQSGGNHTTVNSIYLGYDSGSNGIYNLSGTGSLNTAGVIVGYSGTGTFNQTGGNNKVSDSVLLGASGGSGTYNLSGGNLSTNSEYIGFFGTGTFNQNGGVNIVTNTLTIAAHAGSSGIYNLSGGLLNALNIVVNSGGSFNFNGGTLAVGTFSGNLANIGGTLTPGGGAPGTTNILGNYSQSGAGTLAVTLAGTGLGQFSAVHVSGTATLSGTLDISLFGSGFSGPGYAPQFGDTFDILSAASLSGQFSSLAYAPLSNGLVWDVSYVTNSNGSYVALTAVPAPAAVWLLGSGLLGLLGFSRRRGQ